MIRVTVWYEYTEESGELPTWLVSPDMPKQDFDNFAAYIARSGKKIREVYPEGLMAPIIRELESDPEISVTYTTMYGPNYGLPDDLLNNTDVLIWWAHLFHGFVADELVKKIIDRIHRGMGFIPLHSAHKSKPFMGILGTSGTLKWREGDFCRIWNLSPTHPIAAGIPESIELCEEEMYGEYFDIPKPDDVVFMSWYRGGELFRSGCTWTRGYGKIFYFQPGHETSPSYNNPAILKIIHNAVHWAAPTVWRENMDCPNVLQSPESKYGR